ncbi:MAG: hypothetical protein ACOX69_09875 [Coriobacteriales bacterium]
MLAAHDIGYPIAKLRRPNALRDRNAYFLDRRAKIILEPSAKDRRDDAFYENNKETLASACKKHGTILLSDERLWYEGASRKGFWETIKKLLEPYDFSDIQIVLYLRRQDQFVTSLWSQFVKGKTRESRPLEQYMLNEKIGAVLDYDRGIARIEETFGAENITVRIFNRKLFPGGDVVHDFCDCVGFDFFEEFSAPKQRENPSLTNRAAYLKNLINRGTYARKVDNVFSHPALTAGALEEERDRRPYLSYEQSISLLERYEKGNARIAREYFGRKDGVLFNAPSPDMGHFTDTLGQTEIDALMMLSEALCLERQQREELQARVDELERKLNSNTSDKDSRSIAHLKRGLKRRMKHGN